MAKSRSLTIFLLKQGFDAANSLRDEHKLVGTFEAENLPEGATLLALDNLPQPPWWAGYFGVQGDIRQVTKGAIVFMPAAARTFALCFGAVSHNLKDEAYEYDFGLRVTLNSVDPKQLKSTDLFEPGSALRRRIQVPTVAELTLFDFDKNSNILRSLTGKVREDRKEIFRSASGSTSLKISTGKSAEELATLCQNLMDIYLSEDFKETFKDIQNISPVKDPEKTGSLDSAMLEAMRDKSSQVYITVPDIINHDEHVYAEFAGCGRSWRYDDVEIGNFYDYIDRSKSHLGDLDRQALKKCP